MPLTTSIPTAAQAQAFLTPAKADTSVGVLNKLFGIPNGNWHSLYYQAIGGVGSGSLFFTLLKDLDLVVLAWVTIMLGVVYGIGAISTAHEGKTLGQRYHTIWTPIRSALSLILLAPIPGVGLSAIQGLVLLMVWFSIGGANYLANKSVTYMAKNSGVTAMQAPQNGLAIARQIAQSEISQQYLINFEGSKLHGGRTTTTWTQKSPQKSGGKVYALPGFYTITFTGLDGVHTGQLGQFTINCLSQNGPLCTARKDAITSMVSAESGFAKSLVDSWQAKSGSSSISDTNQAATAGPSSTSYANVIAEANYYNKSVTAAVQQDVQQAAPAATRAMQNAKSSVQSLGWWSLGMYYWQIAGVTNRLEKHIGQSVHWSGYDYKAIKSQIDTPKRFRKIMATANLNVQKAESSGGSSFSTQATQSLLDKIFSSQGTWYAELPSALLLNGDPIANLQAMGDTLVNIEVPAAIATLAGTRAILSGAKDASADIPLAGAVTGGLSGAADGALKAIGALVTTAILAIFVVGLVWAFYLPSVPFIIWTMEIVGWIILVVEALIGGVLWAAGVALPEGEGLIGPRGDQGVMLFMNVMFRPALMVISFFVSFILMGLLGNFVGATFSVFVTGMNNSINPHSALLTVAQQQVGNMLTWLNPLTWIAIAAIVSAIAIMLTHKIFSLIAYIPENVFRWVGGQGVQLGGPEAEKQTRSTIAAVVNKVTPAKKQNTPPAASGSSTKDEPPVAGGDVAGGGETRGGED